METKQQEIDFQSKVLANKGSVIAMTILSSIIALAYIMEGVKGNRTWGYCISVVAIAILIIALSWVLFKGSPGSIAVRYCVSYGYAVLYCYVLLTGSNDLVFTYVFPMLVIITLYNDVAYTKRLGAGVILVNIISVIIRFAKGGTDAHGVTTAEIQVLLVIVVVIFLVMASNTTTKINAMKASVIQEENDHIGHLLDRILKVSKDMSEGVEEVSGQMKELEDSMAQTLNSMQEVSSGTNESANAIQQQLVKTEEIQDNIAAVTQAAGIISGSMDETTQAVATGQDNIHHLRKLTGVSEAAGRDVAKALDTFREATGKMNSITDLITTVAEQTSLLALNASIEAARAGEAGRGFAVVASEISNLAGQTTTATDDITKLIGDINGQLGTMVEQIENLIKTNQEQAQSAEMTAESFDTISTNVDEIKRQSDDLTGIVDQLAIANKAIVDSIQTISAITEEVSAHSNETYAASQQNEEIVKQVGKIVENLDEDAKMLQQEGV